MGHDRVGIGVPQPWRDLAREKTGFNFVLFCFLFSFVFSRQGVALEPVLDLTP